MERSKSAPKLGSIEESPEQEVEEEKDWLRVLALRGSTTRALSARNTVMMNKASASSSVASSATSSSTSSATPLLETVREEDRCLPLPPVSSPVKLLTLTSECDPTTTATSPDDVSPDGLLVRLEFNTIVHAHSFSFFQLHHLKFSLYVDRIWPR